ncbi:MAG: chitooligosaccharide deacetylase [Ruminococcaceae bacterium]|nr:chitooligosaccharide deacetylase [Oscillospiraceae bacterium]
MKRAAILFLIFSVLILPCRADSDAQITYRRVANEDMKIALTFDDGPHPYYTSKILDILKKYGVKATFFFVGQNIEYYPETAEEVYSEGHEIGNHTYTHHRVRAMDRIELLSELNRCDDAIYEIDEYRTRLFRPPEGALDADVEEAARSMDYSVILWSIDTRDWEHHSPDTILSDVLSNIKSGDIILMHDYIGRDSPTPAAVEMLIPALLERGYRFVTVSELMNN